MSKCKTKAIQTYLGIFRHNQAYSKPSVKPGILRAVVYPEPWHIQNQKHIQNPGIFRTPVHWKFWHIHNPRLIQTSTMWNIYDEAFSEKNEQKIFSQYKLAAFSTSWNKYHEVVTPQIVIVCKKKTILEAAGDLEILIYLLIHSIKLAYLQLITVLVYGNSSPNSHEQDYLNFQQKLWQISEFFFTRCKFTKNELFLRYFLRTLLKRFRGLLLPFNFYAFTEHFLLYLY